MFAYIDPTVGARLAEQGKLIRIDRRGRRVDLDRPVPADGFALDVLGPIPLPLSADTGVDAESAPPQWYAVVRHTEREPVDALARSLRAQGAAPRFAELVSHMSVNSVLVFGRPEGEPNPLIRVHSNCLTGDVFGSRRCDCGPQLTDAMRRMAVEGGIIVYMAGHEGRGIGLWAKAATYLLQDGGENTYQANRSLGLPDDSRDFSDAATIVLHFLGGDRPFRLLTNNPKKRTDLEAHGLTRITMERHVAGVGEYNRRYLAAKRDWGHVIDERDLVEKRDLGPGGEEGPGERAPGGVRGSVPDAAPDPAPGSRGDAPGERGSVRRASDTSESRARGAGEGDADGTLPEARDAGEGSSGGRGAAAADGAAARGGAPDLAAGSGAGG